MSTFRHRVAWKHYATVQLKSHNRWKRQNRWRPSSSVTLWRTYPTLSGEGIDHTQCTTFARRLGRNSTFTNTSHKGIKTVPTYPYCSCNWASRNSRFLTQQSFGKPIIIGTINWIQADKWAYISKQHKAENMRNIITAESYGKLNISSHWCMYRQIRLIRSKRKSWNSLASRK